MLILFTLLLLLHAEKGDSLYENEKKIYKKFTNNNNDNDNNNNENGRNSRTNSQL